MKNREGEREGWMREKGREKVGWGRERKWGRESGVREGEKSWVEEGESGGKEREKKGKKTWRLQAVRAKSARNCSKFLFV